jgi:hypothetical protein
LSEKLVSWALDKYRLTSARNLPAWGLAAQPLDQNEFLAVKQLPIDTIQGIEHGFTSPFC